MCKAGGKFSALEHLSRVHRRVKSLPALVRDHPLLRTHQQGESPEVQPRS